MKNAAEPVIKNSAAKCVGAPTGDMRRAVGN